MIELIKVSYKVYHWDKIWLGMMLLYHGIGSDSKDEALLLFPGVLWILKLYPKQNPEGMKPFVEDQSNMVNPEGVTQYS